MSLIDLPLTLSILHLDIVLANGQLLVKADPVTIGGLDLPVDLCGISDMPVNPDCLILTSAHHCIPVNVHPEADTLVPWYSLDDFLALDIPQNDLSILACRSYEGLAVQYPKAATYGKLLVAMPLVGFLDASRNVVP